VIVRGVRRLDGTGTAPPYRTVPYIRSHIRRFDHYTLDLSRTPTPVDYELPILGSVSSDHRLATGVAADDQPNGPKTRQSLSYPF
jgi:hypothetical protein